VQREEQVGGHAVPVRLDVHWDPRVVREPPPAFDVGDALLQPVGPHVGLQIDVVGAQLLHMLEDRLEVIHRLGIALRLPGHAVRAQEVGHFPGVLVVEEAHPAAVEAGLVDHRQLLLQRPLEPVGTAAFHRPQ
jgi:hypothetical protein